MKHNMFLGIFKDLKIIKSKQKNNIQKYIIIGKIIFLNFIVK
jgi:hypothetical protein